VLVNEEHIMLERCVQMRLQTQLHHYRIMMAINVCVYPIKSLEYLLYLRRKSAWKWYSYFMLV
jgi:hypothetical protein